MYFLCFVLNYLQGFDLSVQVSSVMVALFALKT